MQKKIPNLKSLIRVLELVLGSFLILVGLVLLAMPGPGLIAIGVGVLLISPSHGLKLIHFLEKYWWRISAKFFWKWHLHFRKNIPRGWAKKAKTKIHQWKNFWLKK